MCTLATQNEVYVLECGEKKDIYSSRKSIFSSISIHMRIYQYACQGSDWLPKRICLFSPQRCISTYITYVSLSLCIYIYTRHCRGPNKMIWRERNRPEVCVPTTSTTVVKGEQKKEFCPKAIRRPSFLSFAPKKLLHIVIIQGAVCKKWLEVYHFVTGETDRYRLSN